LISVLSTTFFLPLVVLRVSSPGKPLTLAVLLHKLLGYLSKYMSFQKHLVGENYWLWFTNVQHWDPEHNTYIMALLISDSEQKKKKTSKNWNARRPVTAVPLTVPSGREDVQPLYGPFRDGPCCRNAVDSTANGHERAAAPILAIEGVSF
jgi:hypothetical protein